MAPRSYRAKTPTVPGLRYVAWSGRDRDDVGGFDRPTVKIEKTNGAVILRTDGLELSVQINPLTLTWKDPQGRALAGDRITPSDFHTQRRGAVGHYLQRERG